MKPTHAGNCTCSVTLHSHAWYTDLYIIEVIANAFTDITMYNIIILAECGCRGSNCGKESA